MEERLSWLGKGIQLCFGVALFLWSACPWSFLFRAQDCTDPPLLSGGEGSERRPPRHPARRPAAGEGLNKELMRPHPLLLSLLTLSASETFASPPALSKSGTIWGAEVE